MNIHQNPEITATLSSFALKYRKEDIPPPHILLTGPDASLNASIAEDFARQLGLKFARANAAQVQVQGDLSMLLTVKHVALIENIHLLKREFVDKLGHDLHEGEWEVIIGQGPAARIHKMALTDGVTSAPVC